MASESHWLYKATLTIALIFFRDLQITEITLFYDA
jgi:hypothetical protein